MKFAPILLCLLLLAPAPAFAAPISYAQAGSHIGETVAVEGVVKEVFTTRGGTIFLDMGAPYPNNAFVGVIFRDYASEMGDVSGLTGKTVDLSGKITLYRGKPQIILKSRNQLRVR